jgi:hypothetical protein
MIALTVAAAGGAVAATPNPLGPPPAVGTALPADQCLLTHEIGRHSVVDQHTLLIEGFGRSRGTYRLTMGNGCLRSAISSDPIGLHQVGRGKICKPKDVDITARSRHCVIDSIVKLAPDQIAALPRKLKP